MANESTPVLYSVSGKSGCITLNRPEKRNALNDELIAELKRVLLEANADDNLRSIVITGAGADFCSGADLSALRKISEASVDENAEDARALMDLFILIRQIQVPVVAAVRGRALAGGCGLATACDLVLATDTARFGYPEVKIGFVPAMVLAILRRNVPEKLAFELLTRGAEISADEAKQLGLVNKVVSPDIFEAEVTSYLTAFEKVSKSAVALTKSLLYQVDGMAFREALETGADVNVIARMTEDCQKGIARFLSRS
jgi:methylglutaconyl-CoA hydratase